jgi:MFS family permease
MATCQNCGYKNANNGYNCPSCGQRVNDGSGLIVVIAIVAAIIIIVGLLAGPAYLIYQSNKTKSDKHTNWWLLGGLLAAVIAIWLSTYFEPNGDWNWLGVTALYVNIVVLLIALIVLFLRLKSNEYQLVKLFKK